MPSLRTRNSRIKICGALAAGALLSVIAPIFSIAAEETLRDGWMVQSSAKAPQAGNKVSVEGFSTAGWYKTSAPKTVFAVLVENGVYKDPFFGTNFAKYSGSRVSSRWPVRESGYAREQPVCGAVVVSQRI